MSTELGLDHTRSLIAGMTIPPAPDILNRLHAELQKDEPELPVIANIIAEDPGLSALVLKTVNAPFFGMKATVRSIQHATGLLGLMNIVNIVAGLALTQHLGRDPLDDAHWEAQRYVARCAAALARRLGGVSPDEAYMLGLFHDAGQVLMRRRFEDYGTLQEGTERLPGPQRVEQEQQRYRTDHATVGYFLARTWHLDKALCNVIRDHHDAARRLDEHARQDDDEREKRLLCLLKMAEQIEFRHAGGRDDPEWDAIRDLLLTDCGLSEPDFEDLADEIMELVLSS